VQSGIQSDAGNAYFVRTGAKYLQTQTGTTLAGWGSGRAEVSLYKLPLGRCANDRTVCVRYSDTSACIIHDEFEENREGHGFQPCRMARPKFRLQPPRDGAGVILFDLQPCRRWRPQGLKPASLLALDGTAEAVPFPVLSPVVTVLDRQARTKVL